VAILTTAQNAGGKRTLYEFTQGIDVDSRLGHQEIRVQKSWARALAQIGVLSNPELEQLIGALDAADAEMAQGTFEWRVEDEDVHMNLERFLVDRVGDLGKRIHLGRSRNDLIATSLRLYVHDTLDLAVSDLRGLGHALVRQGRQQAGVIVPGMTHLQAGQPVRFGHVLASHGWAIARDIDRLQAAATRALERLPLGSAALAGTTLEIDLPEIAAELGFAAPPINSYDSVGDRDFVLEALSALAICGVHLSRLSEDLIIWSSTPYGLIKLPPAWSTGSSIMPNKRNPDVPELTRARSAHMIGASVDGLALVKGLPTSYASDLHELKGVYMRSIDDLSACLSVLPSFIAEMTVNEAAAARLLSHGHLLATDIANHLSERGVAFREAYGQVAELVREADEASVSIEKLPPLTMIRIAPKLNPAFLEKLSFEGAVEARAGAGGTSLATALAGIVELEQKLG
jgi:argininosuccinate lyase